MSHNCIMNGSQCCEKSVFLKSGIMLSHRSQRLTPSLVLLILLLPCPAPCLMRSVEHVSNILLYRSHCSYHKVISTLNINSVQCLPIVGDIFWEHLLIYIYTYIYWFLWLESIEKFRARLYSNLISLGITSPFSILKMSSPIFYSFHTFRSHVGN